MAARILRSQVIAVFATWCASVLSVWLGLEFGMLYPSGISVNGRYLEAAVSTTKIE